MATTMIVTGMTRLEPGTRLRRGTMDAGKLPDPPDYEEQRRLSFGIAYRMTGSVSDAEELSQKAFLRPLRAALPRRTGGLPPARGVRL